MLKVYGMSTSGNCHKVRMVLAALKLPYAWEEIDTREGTTRMPEFLAKNPNGQVPLLEIDSGVYLPESNAIVFYLAEGSDLLPNGRLQRAQVLQWLFFEQYSHEPYIAVARFLRTLHRDPGSQRALADSKMDGGYRALGVMEQRLSKESFLVGGRYTIADIALYAYTHVAHEAQLDLAPYPGVRRWLERVAGQPRHVPITYQPD